MEDAFPALLIYKGELHDTGQCPTVISTFARANGWYRNLLFLYLFMLLFVYHAMSCYSKFAYYNCLKVGYFLILGFYFQRGNSKKRFDSNHFDSNGASGNALSHFVLLEILFNRDTRCLSSYIFRPFPFKVYCMGNILPRSQRNSQWMVLLTIWLQWPVLFLLLLLPKWVICPKS